MKKFLTVLAVLIGIVVLVLVLQPAGEPVVDSDDVVTSTDNISINSPQPYQQVASPLEVQGEARGMWYFEASFPIRIEDSSGIVLGEHYATAEGEWMTEEFVPYSAQLSFSTPTTATGTLILERANPSGLPEHADKLRIPVQFSER